MSETLFFFSFQNPFDNMPVSEIVSVDVDGDNLRFNTIKEGVTGVTEKKKTQYIVSQLVEHTIDINSKTL